MIFKLVQVDNIVESRQTTFITFNIVFFLCNRNNPRSKDSSGRKRRLFRSFTLASIPATFEKTSKMFQLAKAPLKVKFLVSPKGNGQIKTNIIRGMILIMDHILHTLRTTLPTAIIITPYKPATIRDLHDTVNVYTPCITSI